MCGQNDVAAGDMVLCDLAGCGRCYHVKCNEPVDEDFAVPKVGSDDEGAHADVKVKTEGAQAHVKVKTEGADAEVKTDPSDACAPEAEEGAGKANGASGNDNKEEEEEEEDDDWFCTGCVMRDKVRWVPPPTPPYALCAHYPTPTQTLSHKPAPQPT